MKLLRRLKNLWKLSNMEQNPMFSYSLPDTHEFVMTKKEAPKQAFRDAKVTEFKPAVFIKKSVDPVDEITNGN